MTQDAGPLEQALLAQARWAAKLGSPLYESIFQSAAADLRARGPLWRALEAFDAATPQALMPLPLRVLASCHRRALAGAWPELAVCFPTCGGQADPAEAWRVIRNRAEADQAAFTAALPPAVQTNEPRRSCALLPGFLAVARDTGLPLRLLEVGASAGLNLVWDRFRFEWPGGAWGPPDARARFTEAIRGEPGALPDVRIAERCGCDLNPVRLDGAGRLSLLSFVWADQVDRFRTLDAAIDTARAASISVDQADAVEWIERQLVGPRPGVATVVFHSVVTIYFTAKSRARFHAILGEAGERATPDAPLAWLSMEMGAANQAEVRLTQWPGGVSHPIANAGFHGHPVELV